MSTSTATLVPEHIGFILDGNRRWATEHGLPKLQGHKKGYELLKETAEACFDRGIKYVSAYVFSTENWNRSREEVEYLMELTYRVFTKDLRELAKNNIKIVFLGSKERISKKLLKAIEKTEEMTAKNTGGVLSLCFNYGGRDEIVEAVRECVAEGLSQDQITEESLKKHMYTHDMPDPDFIVRTSGEERLSNFLLWGSAYAELYFTPVRWPDFDNEQLNIALDEYASRARRFGK